MQTFRKKCFEAEKILEIAARHERMDGPLLERSLHALELLGRLVDAGIDPIFKGGTSLLLRLKTIRRLSIDVDIICKLPREKLDPVLEEIGRKPPFLDCELQVRRKDGLPARRHFKFHFKSVLSGERLPMLRTVYADSRRASRVDVRAREIEHEARARIDLVRTNSTNDIFTVMNYGKIPIENGKLFIRYFKVQGTSGNTVTTYFSDLGRFHPNDPQPVLILSPMKAGPEPPLEFAMAQIRGNQTFMETKPFQTEVFIWLFYQRREWVKESEKLGNITNLQQRSIISNAIEQFRSIK